MNQKDLKKQRDEACIATESLRNDALATLPHHYEMIKLQQDVRDRWYRYYLILSGSILSLAIAILAAGANNSRVANADLKESFFKAFAVLGWIIPVAMGLIFLLGICFLGLYQWQVVNYRMYYDSVSRIFKMLALLHSETVSTYKLPNPFEFRYVARAHVNTRVSRKWTDPQFWEADFWANSITFLINSFCAAAGCIAWFAYDSARRLTYFSITTGELIIGIVIFLLVFISHVIMRQILMRLLLKSHAQNTGSP